MPSASLHAAAAARRASDIGVGTGAPTPETPEEAAKEFEKVLLRRFVKVMTEDMFSTSFAGEDGPGWMKSQRGTQRDMMTDMITNHLSETGALPIAEQLMRKWGPSQPNTPPASAPPSDDVIDAPPRLDRRGPDTLRPAPPSANESRFDHAA